MTAAPWRCAIRQFFDGFGGLLPSLLDGARVTVTYSVVTIVLAVLLGLLVTCMRLYLPWGIGRIATVYVELFRNTPLLLQLYTIYYGLSQLSFVTATFAGIAALTLNYGAYEAENIRAGLQAVDRGQWEAAQALGMRTPRTLWHIVLPQAIRTIIPPVANDFIYLFKDSSILSLITITELTSVAHHAADRTFDNTPYLYAAIIYLCMSYPTSLAARWLERR
ncbi:MAG TPA: amino acid ABC transporter permease, partial [Chloroflexota bacterium]|nr:amino acid ABC transporter permease [Chloroflexota bacterium]